MSKPKQELTGDLQTSELAEQLGFPKGTDVQKAVQTLAGPIEAVQVIVQAARPPVFTYVGIDGDELKKLERMATILQIALASTQQQIGALLAVSKTVEESDDK